LLKQRVLETLETVGLLSAKNKLAKHLSKGMGRRLGWAQATIHKPDIVILDEPFAGMDPLGRIQLRSWMKNQIQVGKTLILCTHELEAMTEYCHEYYIIKQGEVVYSSYDKADSLHMRKQPYALAANMDLDQAEAISSAKSLPKWSEAESLKKGVLLTFSEQTASQIWLSALTAENIFIQSYKPSLSNDNNNFNELFQGESKS
jgi:ABC-2 type transport system ATP-binding protein